MNKRRNEHAHNGYSGYPPCDAVIYNPYLLQGLSPSKIQRGYGKSPVKSHSRWSPIRASPTKSQGCGTGLQTTRKPSLKKGLFQIEIEKQNKENLPTGNMILSTRSQKGKTQTNMFAKAVEASPLRNRSQAAHLNPAAGGSGNQHKAVVSPKTKASTGKQTEPINHYLKGEKLSFKRIASQTNKPCTTTSLINRKTSDNTFTPAHCEYNPTTITYSVRINPNPSALPACPPNLPQKQSIKTAKTSSTQQLHKQLPLTSTPSTLTIPANDSMWSSSDRVNISVSDSRVQLDMSPYFVE